MIDLSKLAAAINSAKPATAKKIVPPGSYICEATSAYLKIKKEGTQLRIKFTVQGGDYASQTLIRYIHLSDDMTDEFKGIINRELGLLKIDLATMELGRNHDLSGVFEVVYITKPGFPLGHVHSFNPY